MNFPIELIKLLILQAPNTTLQELAVLDYIVKNQPTSIMGIAEAMYGDPHAGSASLQAIRWEQRGIVEILHGTFPGTTAKTRIKLTKRGQKMVNGELPWKLKPCIRKSIKDGKRINLIIDAKRKGDYWNDVQ